METRCGHDKKLKMSSVQIVIDTNVIVSAFRSDRGASFALLSQLGDPRWKPSISATLMLEYEQSLKRYFSQMGWDLAIADNVLDVLAVASHHRQIFFRWRPLLPDPNDDFLLELAVASGAEYIVTFNLKDFAGIESFGIEAIRPGKFLRILETTT